jgi:phosphate uptake regulator
MAYVPGDTRNVGFAVNVALLVKALERIGHHARSLVECVVSHTAREALAGEAASA